MSHFDKLLKLATSLGKNVFSKEEIASKRLEICRMCPNYSKGRCKVCGCVMAIKSKLYIASCPKGIWEEKLTEELLTGEMSPIMDRNCCGG